MYMRKFVSEIKKKQILYKAAVKIYSYYLGVLRNSEVLRWGGRALGNSEFQLEATSVKKYCEENEITKVTLEKEQTRPQYQAAYFEGQGSKVSEILAPEVYYTILNEVYVCAMNDSVIVDRYLLNDRFLMPLATYANFETEPIIKYSRQGKCRVYGKIRKEVVPEAIALTGLASNNYYHWTFDILSKMAYINQFEELKDVPLIVDVTISMHSTYMELLKLVDRYNHPIIFLARGELIRVERLHYFSLCTFTAVYTKTKPEGYVNNTKPKKAIDMYRKNVLQSALRETKEDETYEKIFLSRGKGKCVVRLENETQVEDLFIAHGFKSINPSDYTIFQQARLFYKAKWVVGDEGAALSNVMYGGPNTHIVCIQPEGWKDNVFSTIAYIANVNFIHLNAVETGERHSHRVDIEYCKRFIAKQIESASEE
ncbi:MAG: hypothetical protein DBX91_15095 [Subdoligranulum variabile]|nr:MAG: hypothetical protein DBX91_15095 [Subdoligranulum variabile]